MSIKVFDFFSGCGGTSTGLSQAGFSIVGALDSDLDSTRTFKMNFPSAEVIYEDIRQLAVDRLEGFFVPDDLILFSGCAPCQPFTRQLTSKPRIDPRRTLLLEFASFIEHYLPHFVLVENVPGLQDAKSSSSPFSDFLAALKKFGYVVRFSVIRAMDYGVPQCRRRLVLLASRIGDIQLPLPTHGAGKLPYSTVRDWIGMLPPISAGEIHSDDPHHQAARLSPLNLQRIRCTPEGGGMDSWPSSLRLKSRFDYTGHTDVYGRLHWDRLASGLTTRCTSLSNGRFGHPVQDRALSLREAALLQTFPKEFCFSGSLVSRSRQVGNAVPPLVAFQLGNAINRAL